MTKGLPGSTATAPADLSPERRAYLAALRRDRRRLVLCRAGVLVGFVLLWELAARVGWIDSFIMSSPSRILATFGELRENQILTHMAVTLYETLTGFCLGAFGGLGLAVLLWQSDFVSRVAEPYLVVLNSLPKIALGPVIIISMIVTVLEMLEGYHTTDPELLRMAGAFGAGRWQLFTKIVFPANLPALFNSLKINIGLSLVGVIAGEFLVSKAGLGYLIVYGGQVFQLDLVMAGVVILALMAVALYGCITLAERAVLRRRGR